MSLRLQKYLLEALYVGESVSPGAVSAKALHNYMTQALIVLGTNAYGEQILVLTDRGRAQVAHEQEIIDARKRSSAILRQLRNRK